jgi:hypothetical protein
MAARLEVAAVAVVAMTEAAMVAAMARRVVVD